MWLLRGMLKSLGVRDYLIGVLAVALFGIVQQWHTDRVELAKAKLVYAHPEIKYQDRVVYKQGPVRIKTIIIHQPSGAETKEIIVDRGEATTETTTAAASTPVPLATTLKEPRADRYLLTLGLNKLSPGVDGKAVFVGYGFKNRLDVQVGGIEHDGFSPWVLATVRF